MAETLYHIATVPFESACRIDILNPAHRAARLHGHSYKASIRVSAEHFAGKSSDFLREHLQTIIHPLDYSLLNDHLHTPTDENLTRWIRKRSHLNAIDRIGIQSTCDSGADMDNRGDTHLWRRYRFEAAHQLPHVPAGHQCGRMHGHGFEVILHANQNLQGAYSEADMGVAFEQMDNYWQPLQERLDYACLNDIQGLENPTSEILADWIWQQLKPRFNELSWVTVYETHTSGCNYNGQQYRIWKEQRFESALQLSHYPESDKRSRLHGHSYMIRLHLMAELDQVMGWTVDYGDVKALFKPLYRQLDHHRLDQIEGIERADLASLLYWIKQHMADSLPQLDRIDLYDTPGCGAILCWGMEGPALPD